MAYALPAFNLSMSWWDGGHTPAVDPPDEVTIPCQLYRSSRPAFGNSLANIRFPVDYSFLTMPTVFGSAGNPIVECPEGSGAYYKVQQGLWMHRGFPNEYLMIRADPCKDDGTTIASDTDLT